MGRRSATDEEPGSVGPVARQRHARRAARARARCRAEPESSSSEVEVVARAEVLVRGSRAIRPRRTRRSFALPTQRRSDRDRPALAPGGLDEAVRPRRRSSWSAVRERASPVGEIAERIVEASEKSAVCLPGSGDRGASRSGLVTSSVRSGLRSSRSRARASACRASCSRSSRWCDCSAAPHGLDPQAVADELPVRGAGRRGSFSRRGSRFAASPLPAHVPPVSGRERRGRSRRTWAVAKAFELIESRMLEPDDR